VLTPADLTSEQLAWQPVESDGHGQWPAASKVKWGPRAIVFLHDSGAAAWDWRSVALAARTYPGWDVKLATPWLLVVIAPAASAFQEFRTEAPTWQLGRGSVSGALSSGYLRPPITERPTP
jgi:hypothetical protein